MPEGHESASFTIPLLFWVCVPICFCGGPLLYLPSSFMQEDVYGKEVCGSHIFINPLTNHTVPSYFALLLFHAFRSKPTGGDAAAPASTSVAPRSPPWSGYP